MHTLVIIDVQPVFRAAKSKRIENPILREIKLAKKNKYPIIVVEYRKKGPSWIQSRTCSFVTKELGGNCVYVTKERDDGASVIAPALRKITKSKTIRVVGVNTGACVIETVNGMIRRGYKVQIVADGCNDEYLGSHHETIAQLKKRKITTKVLRG